MQGARLLGTDGGTVGRFTKQKQRLKRRGEQLELRDGVKMRIEFEQYGDKYILETNSEECLADEIKEAFSRLLVAAGYPPSVLEVEGGSYIFLKEGEMVVDEATYERVMNDSENNGSEQD